MCDIDVRDNVKLLPTYYHKLKQIEKFKQSISKAALQTIFHG
jgi:hypothetical protein